MPYPDADQGGGAFVPFDDSLAGLGDQRLPIEPPSYQPSIGELHPAIAQALGLMPAQAMVDQASNQPPTAPPPSLTPPPMPPDVTLPGDRGPAIAPPPAAAPAIPNNIPPADRPPSAPGAAGDYLVPLSAIGQHAAPHGAGQRAVSSMPQGRPLTPDQRIAQVDQQQRQADQATVGAIGAQADVASAEANQELASYQAHDAEAQRIEAQRKQQQQDLAKTHAEKQAYVDSTLKDLDSYKIDQNKYWNEVGVGHQIGWYIAMALSGLGQALDRKVGPNPVIQMLQDKMHQSVVAQMDQRDQLKERNARAEHALDKYDQYSQSREAQINLLDARNDKMLASTLLTTAAKFKSPQAQAQAQAQAAQLMQESTGKAQKSAEFAATYDTQKRQLSVAQGHLGLAQSELGLKRQELDFKKQEFDWTKDKDQQKLDLEAAREALAQQKALTAKGKELGVAAPTVDGKIGLLTDKDGSVHQFRSAEIAQKNSDMVAASMTYNRLVQKMVQAVKDHGGESGWIKGGDWQRMTSDLQSATAELHDAYGITSFREPTVKFFEEMATSGVDPNSFARNATAALQNSNDNLHAKVNDKLRATGYNGPEVSFAPTDAPEAAPSRIEQLSTILKARPGSPERAYEGAFNESYGKTHSFAQAHVAGWQAEQSVKTGGPDYVQLSAINELKSVAQSGGPDAQAAAAALKDIVDKRSGDAQKDHDNPGLLAPASSAYWNKKPEDKVAAAAAAAIDDIAGKTVTPLDYGQATSGGLPDDMLGRFKPGQTGRGPAATWTPPPSPARQR